MDKIQVSYKDLLSVDVTSDDWSETTARKNGFYVRGFSAFRKNVLRAVGGLKQDIYFERKDELLATVSDWDDGDFDWSEKLSARQANDAASTSNPKRLQFHKAVQVILLCEAASQVRHERGRHKLTDGVREAPINYMRIEPAVSYINGFDNKFIDNLLSYRSDALDLLRALTGQRDQKIFRDMANGVTVSHKLATRTHLILRVEFEKFDLGDVDFTFREIEGVEAYPDKTNERVKFSAEEVRKKISESAAEKRVQYLEPNMVTM